jgi:[ribosomal protein S5]-alanine N-acetyltransferase
MQLPIETARLVLREMAGSDWSAIDAYNRAPEFHRFLPIDSPGAGATQGFVQLCLARARERPRRHYDPVICERVSAAVIGTLRLSLRDPGVADLGYAVRPERWRCGFATEAAQALLAAARKRLGLREVRATADPANTASCRVLEKLGFTRREGEAGHPIKPGRPPSIVYVLNWPQSVSERTVQKAVELAPGRF